MSEDTQQLIRKNTAMPAESYPDLSAGDSQEESSIDKTRKLSRPLSKELQRLVGETQEESSIDKTRKLPRSDSKELQRLVESSPPPPQPPIVHKKAPADKVVVTKITRRDTRAVRMIQERCKQLCFSLFFRDNTPVRSVGFTSSIDGEGKSFLSLVTAQVLAHDTGEPVTLVECNWEHPTLHEYFGIPATPGLAELLRGSCSEDDIRYQVEDNLTIIPAGNGSQDSIKLLKPIQQVGLRNFFANKNGLFVVDLPPILTAGYGSLAASLLESLIIVVRAQITSDSMLAETYSLIKDLPVHGIILNQRESRIPHWIRQLL